MPIHIGHTPIQTVAEAKRRARRRLPKPVYIAVLAGNEKGLTRETNVAAWSELGFNPRVGGAIAPERDLRAQFMGQPVSMPHVMSPAGARAIHPEGELPVARATRKADLAMGPSNFASSPFEEIAAENPKSSYQLYWSGDRDSILRSAGGRARRART